VAETADELHTAGQSLPAPVKGHRHGRLSGEVGQLREGHFGQAFGRQHIGDARRFEQASQV